MVRTCSGLELRDVGFYSDSEAFAEDPSGLFPSASSRDELTPRYITKQDFSSAIRNM